MASDRESSFTLLRRARAGDNDALTELIERYWPRLRAWASGRLPPTLGSVRDSGDLVHNAILQALMNVDSLGIHTEAGLLDYLRASVNQAIVIAAVASTSPLDATIGTGTIERYERALAALRDQDRQAVILRVEFGLTYEEIATHLNESSIFRARVVVTRAIARLAAAMGHAA
jgi:RNA polymerase sigma-70 factor (ECF subfamily)